MAKIRQRDKDSIMNALAGGVTPRQGIQFIQVGRKEETEALLNDIKAIEAGDSSFRIIDADYGSGKAAPLDTPVLTKNGWVELGSLQVGDLVYTMHGTTAPVTDIYEHPHKQVYEMVLRDGRKTYSCGEHLWSVIDTNTNAQNVITTHSIIEQEKTHGDLRLPSPRPFEFADAELPLEPYVLGILLVCGVTEQYVSINVKDSFDLFYVDKISHLLGENIHWHSVGHKRYGLFQGNGNWTEHPVTTESIINNINGIAEQAHTSRYIDRRYLSASVSQRKELLRGLMDAGGVTITGEHVFKTLSPVLAKDMLYLIRSLGMSGHVAESSNDQWNLVYVHAESPTIFTMPSKVELASRHQLSNKRHRLADNEIVSVKQLDEYADMRCISVDDDTHTYIIDDFVVTHNTFMMTLTKSVALKRNMLVMQADLSPDRRLYSSSGKAKAFYQELVRSLSSVTSPDGGAMMELLDALDERISLDNRGFLANIRKLPYGFDAVTVIAKWHQSKHPATPQEERDSFMVQDACLRWFSSENTVEHKKLLGVKSTIGDTGAYDALKLIAMLSHYAGYGGLLVEIDECVNLYKINDSTSRDRNYEQILRMFNESRQGDSHYIGFVLAGTPEFVMDPRRGLFSYDALQSRLVTSQYEDSKSIDMNSPIIDLKPMPQESLFVMLRNIVNVEALGDESKYLVTDGDIKAYLKKCFDTLGADYFRTPREIIRDFVAVLRNLADHPELSPADVIGKDEVSAPRRESGLGTSVRMANTGGSNSNKPKAQNKPVDKDSDDDGEFGF